MSGILFGCFLNLDLGILRGQLEVLGLLSGEEVALGVFEKFGFFVFDDSSFGYLDFLGFVGMVVVVGEDARDSLLFGGEVTGGDVGKLFDFFPEFGVVFHAVDVLKFFILE